MATISARKGKGGAVSYTAQIRIKRDGVVIHSESQTFPKKTMAEAWAKKRETELSAPGEIERSGYKALTVGQVVSAYHDDYRGHKKWGRSKTADLQALVKSNIAGKVAVNLNASDVIKHIHERRKTCGPATALNDVIWLGVAFKTMRAAKGWPLPVDAIEEARTVLRATKVVAKSNRRDRRPTPEELNKLRDYYSRKDGRMAIPMLDIMDFALASSRRQEEITRLRWDDLDRETLTCWLRDAKHPTKKEGNHKQFKLLRSALDVIDRQPKIAPEIFPYNHDSISAAFTRACRMLGIVDLRFHDLRHEATCNLFELGYQIHEVAMFTLHESWATLKRYTNLRAQDIEAKA